MRLFKFLLLVVVVAVIGRLVARTVSLESTPSEVRITINKQKLKEAGRDLEAKGRQAAGRVGQALEQAGEKHDHDRDGRQTSE